MINWLKSFAISSRTPKTESSLMEEEFSKIPVQSEGNDESKISRRNQRTGQEISCHEESFHGKDNKNSHKKGDNRGNSSNNLELDKEKVDSAQKYETEYTEDEPSKKITRMGAVEMARSEYLKMSPKQKRKEYKCGNNYNTLDDIPLYPLWAKCNHLQPCKEVERKAEHRNDLNMKLGIFEGDITTLEIDAVVNAANMTLLGGGGVDGAIHRAAGSNLLKECRTLNGCETGEAKITAGYKMPAKYIIHTVGPTRECEEELRACYENSLNLAVECGCRHVAFPCISTGIYGYSNKKAAIVALETVRKWLDDPINSENIDRVIFCLFLSMDKKCYSLLLPCYFP